MRRRYPLDRYLAGLNPSPLRVALRHARTSAGVLVGAAAGVVLGLLLIGHGLAPLPVGSGGAAAVSPAAHPVDRLWTDHGCSRQQAPGRTALLVDSPTRGLEVVPAEVATHQWLTEHNAAWYGWCRLSGGNRPRPLTWSGERPAADRRSRQPETRKARATRTIRLNTPAGMSARCSAA